LDSDSYKKKTYHNSIGSFFASIFNRNPAIALVNHQLALQQAVQQKNQATANQVASSLNSLPNNYYAPAVGTALNAYNSNQSLANAQYLAEQMGQYPGYYGPTNPDGSPMYMPSIPQTYVGGGAVIQGPSYTPGTINPNDGYATPPGYYPGMYGYDQYGNPITTAPYIPGAPPESVYQDAEQGQEAYGQAAEAAYEQEEGD
jgi:hypothetical protein